MMRRGREGRREKGREGELLAKRKRAREEGRRKID